MSILLSVLQIIGWILLTVILICVLGIFLVLFVPVRYELEGETKENLWAKARVHWLLRRIGLRLNYEDDLVFVEIHIFFKKISFTFDLSKKEEEAEADVTSDIEETAEETIENIEEAFEENKESIISKIKGMIEYIKKIYPKIKRVVTDEQNHKAVAHLKEEVFYLIKILLPKKARLNGVFSTGSPDTTGQALGIMACVPVFYDENCKIYPNFESEEAYFKGEFWGKGKIYGFQLLGIVLRVLLDRDCRRMYAMVQALIRYLKNNKNH